MIDDPMRVCNEQIKNIQIIWLPFSIMIFKPGHHEGHCLHLKLPNELDHTSNGSLETFFYVVFDASSTKLSYGQDVWSKC